MPKLALSDDPEHWRERAAEARRLADRMDDDPIAKSTMLGIVEAYERLAEMAQARLASKQSG
jgi:hypothetical protein